MFALRELSRVEMLDPQRLPLAIILPVQFEERFMLLLPIMNFFWFSQTFEQIICKATSVVMCNVDLHHRGVKINAALPLLT